MTVWQVGRGENGKPRFWLNFAIIGRSFARLPRGVGDGNV